MKRRNLLWIKSVGTLIDIDPRELSSDDYGRIYDAMKAQSGVRDKFEWAQIVELDRHQCIAGVFWDWELAGPGGASYRIHVLPGISDGAVAQCKAHIRNSYDCIRMSVNRIDRLIDFVMPQILGEQAAARQDAAWQSLGNTLAEGV